MNVHTTTAQYWNRVVLPQVSTLKIASQVLEGGAQVWDWGCEVPGGLAAGCRLAEVCLAGLGSVQIASLNGGQLAVTVQTDHPIWACLGSQYAGWPVSAGKFFGMGSGPLRAARGKEKMLLELGLLARAAQSHVVLETRHLPTDDVAQALARGGGIAAEQLVIHAARTASLAGTIQIVARSVETCLHQLHERGFDLSTIQSAWGQAPLPPIPRKDLTAMGWTNDAILYAGQVTLWVAGDDDTLAEIGPKVPSQASSDFGRPFLEIFEACGRDFYQMDPQLFSPAEVTLINQSSGRVHRFGKVHPEIWEQSLRQQAN